MTMLWPITLSRLSGNIGQRKQHNSNSHLKGKKFRGVHNKTWGWVSPKYQQKAKTAEGIEFGQAALQMGNIARKQTRGTCIKLADLTLHVAVSVSV